MKFPAVTGTNLAGRKFALPADFEGKVNLVMIAFQRFQQSMVDSWLPTAKRLAETIPHLHYYELPTIRRGHPLFRWWLDNVMQAGIPNKELRQITITLYLDKEAFRKSLEIPHEKTIQVMLVNPQGEVLWRTEGAYTPEKEWSLNQVLNNLNKAT